MNYKIVFLIFIFSISSAFFVSAAVPTVSFYFNTSSGNQNLIESNIVRSSATIFQVLTDRNVVCKYTKNYGIPYEAMDGSFDFNFGTVHRKNIFNLVDGVQTYYVSCRNSTDQTSSILTLNFNVITPVTATISLSKDSPLNYGFVGVTLITSKPVLNTPSLSYSFNGVSYNPVTLSGSSTQWNGNILIPSSIGESIGSFSFNAQDLDGFGGNEIKLGSSFIVDTIKPKTVIDFDAIGYKGRIELNWYSEDDDLRSYRIYRSLSQGVGYSNFYKEVDSLSSYTDVSVEAGKTYYYRVIPVDEAGNYGELSIEAYATALLNDLSNYSTGLSPSLIGQVDNFLSSVDIFLSDIKQIEGSAASKSLDESIIFEDLGLLADIQSSKTELNFLHNDVSKYKLQNLNQLELTNKLQAAELKINTIKKKIPEDLIIIDKSQSTNTISEQDIQRTLFEAYSLVEESSLEYKIKNSMNILDENKFSVKSELYNFEVVYLDGSRSKKSLIRHFITAPEDLNDSFSIVHTIPKDIANSVSEINFKEGNYQILKDDPIISFDSSTKEVKYFLNKNIDDGLLEKIKTMPIYLEDSQKKSSYISGYFTFNDFEKSTYGVYLGFILITLFGFYFYRIKSSIKRKEMVQMVKNRLLKANNFLNDGDVLKAKNIYGEISKDYKLLKFKDKIGVYGQIHDLVHRLNSNE